MTDPGIDPGQLRGAQVHSQQGEQLGKVREVYLDNQTRRPEWIAVATGLFGTRQALVPLATATYIDGAVSVPHSKDQLRSAPHHDPDRELSTEQEKELFEHYGISYSGSTVTARAGSGEQHTATLAEPGDRSADEPGAPEHRGGESADVHSGQAEGRDVSGPTTDEAMTRSEEQLRAGTETVETGRARLRKYVVTEQQTVTVPTSREEVVVEREPITEANRGQAQDGPAISEEEHEVTLHAERPVISKEAEPVERVRMGTETVRDEESVTEDVRKEQIEVDDPDSRPGR